MEYRGFDFEVFGKVQGVFFRKHTEEKAKELGLVGWVMNTLEGTVVGQAQGDPKALLTLRKWLSEEGSPKSRIDRCHFTNEKEGLATLEFSDFGVKRPKRPKKEGSGGEKRKSSGASPSSTKVEGNKQEDETQKIKKKKKKEKKTKDEDSKKTKNK